MPPQFVFEMTNVSKRYGDKVVLRDISLSFYYGAKIGVVGENGAGKSTLLKIMAGLDNDFHGQTKLAAKMKVRYVAQEPQLELDKTVRDHLQTAIKPILDMVQRFDAVSEKLGNPGPEDDMDKLLEEMGRLQDQIDACGGWETDRLIEIVSDAMVLPPDDAVIRQLSGGERRRVALCMALLEKPDLLLLDEPTNHLDAETIQWLENALRDYPGTVIIVTHDRYFLDNITKWILELENGYGLPFEGNYSSWLAQKAELLRIAEKKESQRQKTLLRELEWINTSVKGRNQKNQARIHAYEELAARAEEAARSEVLIQIPSGPRLGQKVLAFHHVSKSFGSEPLIEDCSFELPPNAIVGVIGPNGIGKTTLFRLITGEIAPDSGTIEIGPSVSIGYVDQHRDALDGNRTIFEEISDGKDVITVGGRDVNARAYAAKFNFRGSQQQKKVSECSGGERNRIHLAKMLRRGGNLLLLDEPTNDLDINTMRVLEQSIIDFQGSAMVISHDRFFLDRICTHLLIFEGAGKIQWFVGNFAAYEEKVLAENPERIAHRRSKYKKLKLR
ncbi:MAG TPA: energy-dependent translational throttle protein EttA [Anaerohalosphaeraceae bacterium]|nr:energy-dependent translational throttle protein EttA [Anaerohalosphaeraceae bacterium]HOM76635.1 energy-dependent translational throttle protein EttA [Anaerohalosphaeraceae bacterium]HPC63682.1 energy-dependent translational throttle protein EttA [Anaerohalosphaeraceae bacterium]HPO69383.1 energy-dependent translational throttle protein EttA [Anaerohalosphaeraceae bacterium]HRS70853.1 energy-dependent translational throttle protein EttA [Anaerohalosphaeraceae bacterium]